jgi:hypothetical protein
MDESKQKRGYPSMTVEWLRTFEGFENYTDQEAEEALKTIRSLAQILIGVYNRTDDKNPSEL